MAATNAGRFRSVGQWRSTKSVVLDSGWIRFMEVRGLDGVSRQTRSHVKNVSRQEDPTSFRLQVASQLPPLVGVLLRAQLQIRFLLGLHFCCYSLRWRKPQTSLNPRWRQRHGDAQWAEGGSEPKNEPQIHPRPERPITGT